MEVCVFDTSAHANGGCIFDNEIGDPAKTRPFRKGWDWRELERDDDDIVAIIICATQTIL